MVDINGVEKTLLEHHMIQLQSSGVPQHLWPALFRKLLGQVYDAGESFQLCQLTYADGERDEEDPLWQVIVIKPEGIKADDPDSIFVIDHAWTYRAHEARHCLRDIPGLLDRMVALMDIPNNEDNNQQQLIEKVLQEMWKYNGTYSLAKGNPEESLPVWYIMDEFGARIQHCGEPNFRVVPFYFSPHECCYSLLFPIQDTEEGEEVTRNYVECGPVDSLTRDAQMLPWFPLDLSHIDPTQEEPPEDFFLSSCMNETLPDPNNTSSSCPLSSHRPLKVFAEYMYVHEYLTHPSFVMTKDKDQADILWFTQHFKDFRGLRETPERRVNQYPCEYLLTLKNLLAVVSHRASHLHHDDNQDKEDQETKDEKHSNTNNYPSWLPHTYCLKRELHKFVSVFQRREKRGLDNHWIIKPWNLARGMDHTITNNLNHILRLPSTGPKIAQKYLSDPVLFHRDDIDADVKFDVRYIVMLLNAEPLKVAVYRHFWIRFANEPFDLSQLDNSQKHFTVNNYNEASLLQMYCHDFISKFNEQNPEQPWEVAEKKIYSMMHQVFKAAVSQPAPRGLPNNPQCKGFYGIDIMLDWIYKDGKKVMQPQLLEINFNSDCKRACEYYPEFYNDVFAVMFLDETVGHHVAVLE
ncbi:hypothetical protein Pmani_000297 [Petrolisthes manimaculis]|uniref:Tubulin--tyrosine ligase-like protein 12 SET-like domain-containing protein n=1 Tax=Petrolisthes manimaculis TaxID=1843537 RepID=A0AAE1QMQ9_9EUCA|nr:hypothetical protein Pmani_000297 [Petrolisthes manimaculis]